MLYDLHSFTSHFDTSHYDLLRSRAIRRLVPLLVSWFSSSAVTAESLDVNEPNTSPMVTECPAPVLRLMFLVFAGLLSSRSSGFVVPISNASGSADVPLIHSNATSSTSPVPSPDAVDNSGMPTFETANELPIPMDAWSPEAILTWMCGHCLRRHAACTDNARKGLYDSRFAVLREDSPSQNMSVIDILYALADAEPAYEIGSQLVQTFSAASSSRLSSSHVNAVADAMINMISSNPGDGGEEETSESDAEMETESRKNDALPKRRNVRTE
eukprot:s1418_g6.t1